MNRAKYDGGQILPCITALLILSTKSCRNRLGEAPVRELTKWESATLGGWGTSRWTRSSARLNSAGAANKSAHTCAMTCSHRLSICVSNTPRRYLVTKTKWTWFCGRGFCWAGMSALVTCWVSQGDVTSCAIRFRPHPSDQQRVLLGQCAHVRYVWNLGLAIE